MIKKLNKSENSIAFLFVLSVLSLTFPYNLPLFGIVTAFFVSLKLITGRFKIRLNTGIALFFIVIFFYIIGVLWTGQIYTRNKVDLINIMGYIMIWIILSDLDRNSYKILMNNIAKYTTFVMFFVALFSLYKLIGMTGGSYFDFLYAGDRYPTGTSLMLDYNMFALGLMSGLLFSLYLLLKTERIQAKVFYFISFFTILTSILLAGSRRAWVVSLIIAAFVIFVILRHLFSIVKKLNYIGLYMSLYFLIICMFVFISGNSIFSNKIFSLVLLILLAAPVVQDAKKVNENVMCNLGEAS